MCVPQLLVLLGSHIQTHYLCTTESTPLNEKESYQNLSEPVSIGKQMVSTTGKYDRLKFIYDKFLEKAKLEFEKEKGDFIHIDNAELSLKQAEKNQKKNIKILKQPSNKNNPLNKKKLIPIVEWTSQ